ncbi:MAG: tyrosine-type recombinase/integrase [Firmicutes bacterium]|nr:tyrosine-type recombinase/integrase [Bacillota bacterium]
MKQQQEKRIDELVRDAIQYISMNYYSTVSINFYSWIWHKLLKYAHEKQVQYYSIELGYEFFYQLTGIDPSTKPDKYGMQKIRALKVLNDLSLGNKVKKNYIFEEPFVPDRFIKILEAYSKHLSKKGQKEKTLETKLSRIRVFLRYLDLQGIRLEDVDFQVIANFYLFLSSKYTSIARSNIQFTLRDFLVFADSIGAVKSGASRLITRIYSNKHERLPSTYSTEEINRILAVVDRSTKYGKRDYVMLLLAIQLGMRRSDICHMKLEGVCLEGRHIIFRQEKTGSIENLPITELLAYALADYLKHARPATDSELLFVHMGANRGSAYSGSTLYAMINKYMRKANINTNGKRHGMHSMRHSLSSNLLKEGTPLPVISGILGHSSTEITTRYLWMDTEQLRKLSLEVPYEE